MKIRRLTICYEITHEDVEILTNTAVPEYAKDIFNGNELAFKVKEGLHYTNKKNISLIEVRKIKSIPRVSIPVCRISIADGLTFSPAYLILNKHKAATGVIDIFGDDQISFIADKLLYITRERNVIQIQCNR